MLHSVAAVTLLLGLAPVSHAAMSPDAMELPANVLLMPCSQAGDSCEVTIRSRQHLRIAGVVRVGVGRTLRILPGGALLLEGGGTLDFGGGKVDAPANEHVFGGEGSIRGLASAYPEWFADPIEPQVYPAAALAEAYAATVDSGVVRFNAATYLSPFSSDRAFMSPRTFLGAGRPVPDNDSAPTRLVGGTILAGEVRGLAALRVEHLGIDAGDYIAARYLEGVKGFGLALFSTAAHTISGSEIKDVSVLATGVRNQHSVIVEGQHELHVDGLWVWTPGGTHGLVMKSDHSTVHDFHCRGAANDCLIVKSDYATDKAGYAAFDDFSDIDIRYLSHPGDTGGILIDSSWDKVHDIRMRGVREDGVSYGLSSASSFFHHAERITINDWQVTNTQGFCMAIPPIEELTVDGFSCELGSMSSGFILQGGTIRLLNGEIRTTAANRGAAIDGVLDYGGKVMLRNIHASGLGGYLLRSSSAQSLDSLKAAGLTSSDGRVLAPEQLPLASLRVKWQIFWRGFRLAGRLVWTSIVTRVGLVSLIVIGLVLVVVFVKVVRGKRAR